MLVKIEERTILLSEVCMSQKLYGESEKTYQIHLKNGYIVEVSDHLIEQGKAPTREEFDEIWKQSLTGGYKTVSEHLESDMNMDFRSPLETFFDDCKRSLQSVKFEGIFK